MSDLSVFAGAEMEGGSERDRGRGANDRIWARCRQISRRCRVTGLTAEINTRMERDEGQGGRSSRYSDISISILALSLNVSY